MDVHLGITNFTHLHQLLTLIIDVADDNIHRTISPITSNHTGVFKPLQKLNTLYINVVWELNDTIPELLLPLKRLDSMSLANTKRIHVSKLIQTLYGLQDDCKLKTLSLFNIQTLEFATLMGQTQLNFSELLHPLRNCPLKTLNIGYNALQVLHPGLMKYAPKLLTLITSNNMLTSFLKSSALIDILLHPKLTNIYLHYQGYGYVREQQQMMVQSQSQFHLRTSETSSLQYMSGHKINNAPLRPTMGLSNTLNSYNT